MVSLGPHVNGFNLPHPNSSDSFTCAHGAIYRSGRKIDIEDHTMLSEIGRFVEEWLPKNLTPLSADSDISVESWLKDAPYSQARKIELQQKFEKSGLSFTKDVPPRYLMCKSFIKDETYPEYKPARGINSRSDEFKVLVGPIIQLVTKQLFQLDWFIKKTPIDQRPSKLFSILNDPCQTIFTSDYSSFEASFSKEIMMMVEDKLFEYMTKNLPVGSKFLDVFKQAKHDVDNFLSFKHFAFSMEGKRMSGEMDTSTSNSFSNLMFMLYICQKNGNDQVRGFIEGDDGIFRMRGEPPNSKLFGKLGLDIKIINFQELNIASFCGLVFDPEDKINVTDPIKTICDFGWGNRKYLHSKTSVLRTLLRCKALSLLHQYKGCPIIYEMAQAYCRLTSGLNVEAFLKKHTVGDSYKHELVLEAHRLKVHKMEVVEVPFRTRILVEKLYGISVVTQHNLEAYFKNLNQIEPIPAELILGLAPPLWARNYAEYARVVDPKTDTGAILPCVSRERDLFNPYVFSVSKQLQKKSVAFARDHKCCMDQHVAPVPARSGVSSASDDGGGHQKT